MKKSDNLFPILTLVSMIIFCVGMIDEKNTNDVEIEEVMECYIQPATVGEDFTEISSLIETYETSTEAYSTEETSNISCDIDDKTYFGYTIDDFEFLKNIDNGESDIDDDQIQYILDLCNDKGVNPYLISSIIYTESRGKSDVYNKENCRGYGGISEVAGEFIYENVLDNGEYNHNMAFDPYTNLSIMINLLDYLMADNEADIEYVVQYYSGTKGEQWYIDYTNDNLEKFGGPTLQEMEEQWIERYNQRKNNNMEENNND